MSRGAQGGLNQRPFFILRVAWRGLMFCCLLEILKLQDVAPAFSFASSGKNLFLCGKFFPREETKGGILYL